MGIYYYAMIGAGYIVDNEKAEQIMELPEYPDRYEGWLYCLDPFYEDSEWFFERVIQQVELGCPDGIDTTDPHLIELLDAKEEYGSVLNIDNEYDLDIHLMVRRG